MKDNERLNKLIESLKIQKKGFWRKVASELAKPRRSRAEVNISKLDIYGNDGSTVLVPGKVLGSGNITKKKMVIAAFSFSESARKFIESSGGKAISIEQLYESNKDGKDILLIK